MVNSNSSAGADSALPAAREEDPEPSIAAQNQAQQQKSRASRKRKQETNNNNITTAADASAEAVKQQDDELTSSSAAAAAAANSSASRSTSLTDAGMSPSPQIACAPAAAANDTCCAQKTAANAQEVAIHLPPASDQSEPNVGETNRLLQLAAAAAAATRTANGCHPATASEQQDIEQATHRRQDSNLLNNNQKPLLEDARQGRQFDGSNCKQLTYLQVLLIRKWPYLALTICIMGALIFGILLSSLTVFLMHGQSSDCLAAAALGGGGGGAKSGRLMAEEGQAGSPLLAAREFGHESPLLGHELGMLMPASHLSPSGEASSQQLSGAPGAAGAPGSSAQEADLRGKSGQPVAAPSRFQRLPTSLWPVHYDLFVQPYLYEPFNFTGKVLIRIRCTGATDNITLHALDLDLNSSGITLSELPTIRADGQQQQQEQAATEASMAGGHQHAVQSQQRAPSPRTTPTPPKVSGLSQDRQLQHSIIRLDRQLEPGKEYLLGIDFVGFLNDDLAGFYKIKYELKNSTTPPTTTVLLDFCQLREL